MGKEDRFEKIASKTLGPGYDWVYLSNWEIKKSFTTIFLMSLRHNLFNFTFFINNPFNHYWLFIELKQVQVKELVIVYASDDNISRLARQSIQKSWIVQLKIYNFLLIL